MRDSKLLFVLSSAIIGFSVVVPASSHAQVIPRHDVVALTGDALPDGGPGTYGTLLLPPVLNDPGEATLYATLEGTGTAGDRALFRGNAAGLTQVIRFGEALPGVAETFMGVRNVLLNNHGQIAAEGGTNGPADNMILIFDDQAGPQIVAKVGDPPPVGSRTFVDFGFPRLNDAGAVAFSVSLVAVGSPDTGVYRGDAGGLTEIQRGGINRNPALNDSGQMFVSTLGVDEVMYFYDGSALNEVTRSGHTIPGGTGTFGGPFTNASINESGQFALASGVRPEGGGTSRSGLFFFDPLTGLADALPLDTPAPDGNGDFDRCGSPFLNDAGQLAFSATLANTSAGSGDDSGAYLLDGPGGDLVTMARELQRPPDQDGVFSRFAGIALNDRGHAAFDAELRATSAGTVRALYFFDPAIGLIEIIRDGDPFLGSTLAEFTFNPGAQATQYGIPANEGSGLNNRDQIAFSFRLSDGRQGVAITTVPEPTAGWLLLMLLASVPWNKAARRNTH